MAVFPRPVSPRTLWADLRAFIAQQERYKWGFGALSIMMPAIIVLGFYHDANIKPPPLGIIYVQSWPADRTDAQIKAQQKIDQAKRDAFRRERQRQFQRLADQLGIK